MFASTGILFNHESPRRGETFVTRKITRFLARKFYGLEDILYLGNLYSKRDWGHAKDFVEMQWKILQQKKPDDFIISTGEAYSVKEFINEACKQIGFKIKWSGKGFNEKATLINKDKKVFIKIDKRYFRPLEVDYLRGKSSKAIKRLNFKPKYSFKRLISDMLKADLKIARSEFFLKKMVNKKSKIFITGHKGLVGSSVYNLLKNNGFKNLIIIDKKKLDLLDTKKVYRFIKKKRVDIIINCAARVGGILANSTYPVEFLYENIQMQNNLLLASKKFKVKRFIFLGSSCIYPRNSKTPINENQLLSGKLEKTNEAYAIGKITGIKLSEYLFNQKQLDVICLMPTNVYGVNDNYDKFSSHVIPGMIMKFIDAIKRNKKSRVTWNRKANERIYI